MIYTFNQGTADEVTIKGVSPVNAVFTPKVEAVEDKVLTKADKTKMWFLCNYYIQAGYKQLPVEGVALVRNKTRASVATIRLAFDIVYKLTMIAKEIPLPATEAEYRDSLKAISPFINDEMVDAWIEKLKTVKFGLAKDANWSEIPMEVI